MCLDVKKLLVIAHSPRLPLHVARQHGLPDWPDAAADAPPPDWRNRARHVQSRQLFRPEVGQARAGLVLPRGVYILGLFCSRIILFYSRIIFYLYFLNCIYVFFYSRIYSEVGQARARLVLPGGVYVLELIR